MSDNDEEDDLSHWNDEHKDQTRDDTCECPRTPKPIVSSPGVHKKLRALAFGGHKKPGKESSKKKKSLWTSKSNTRHRQSSEQSDQIASCSSCLCSGYKKTSGPLATTCKKEPLGEPEVQNIITLENFQSVFKTVTLPAGSAPASAKPFFVDDWDELARQERAKEIEEGIDPPPGFRSQSNPTPQSEFLISFSQKLNISSTSYRYLERLSEVMQFSQAILQAWEKHLEEGFHIPRSGAAHSQVDYVHCLVPYLSHITNCSFYWGKMDRYEAEKLLDKKPEGTFLLRDSAQEEFLFSVSFRRYGRTLHARIEQWNHNFSFDSHDPSVFASDTVCGLIEHYKDPSCCMFFEPMLTLPLNRSLVFPLQHLCRSVICDCLSYDGINKLPLPKKIKSYLKEYHYKQRVRVRRFDQE